MPEAVISGRETRWSPPFLSAGIQGNRRQPAADTIYVTNVYDHTVSVISRPTNTVVAAIPAQAAPEGVAVNP